MVGKNRTFTHFVNFKDLPFIFTKISYILAIEFTYSIKLLTKSNSSIKPSFCLSHELINKNLNQAMISINFTVTLIYRNNKAGQIVWRINKVDDVDAHF